MDQAIRAAARKTTRRIRKMMENHPYRYDETKVYSDNFITVISPLKFLLTIFGQFPFTLRKETDTDPQCFSLGFGLFNTILFIASYAIFADLQLGLTTFFFPALTLKLQPYILKVRQENLSNLGTEVVEQKDWERELVRRNFAAHVNFYMWMFYIIAMNFTVMWNRKRFLSYLNYWLFSFQILQIDIKKTINSELYAKLFMVFLITVFFAVGLYFAVPTPCQLADMHSHLLLRIFHFFFAFRVPDAVIDETPSVFNFDFRPKPREFYVYKATGLIFMIYVILGLRISIMFPVFFNRLLVIVTKEWNQRLRDALMQNEDADLAEAAAGIKKNQKVRLALNSVLQDHFTIVQLYKMTEDLFGVPMIIFYFMQTFCMMFTLYFIVSVYPSEIVINQKVLELANDDQRMEELILKRLSLLMSAESTQRSLAEFAHAVLMFGLIFFSFFTTTDAFNAAYKEGMAGFEILRRNCYLGHCDTKEERNFVHTLIVSFAPNNALELSAHGYFLINRSLIPAIMLNVMGYLVACYTLKPTTDEFWYAGQYTNMCRPLDGLAKRYNMCPKT